MEALACSAFSGYTLGLGATILVMNVFKAAQPALLYIVPAVLGAVVGHAYQRRELKEVCCCPDSFLLCRCMQHARSQEAADRMSYRHRMPHCRSRVQSYVPQSVRAKLLLEVTSAYKLEEVPVIEGSRLVEW